MNKLQMMEQFRRAVQMFAASLDSETALEVATIYDVWQADKAYESGEYLTYGTNDVGDPQLYRVISDHVSQDDWRPDITQALYEPLGLNAGGYPIWSRPSGAHDAYNIGDIVDYNGVLYKSLIDGNTYSPDEYPAGWEIVEQ